MSVPSPGAPARRRPVRRLAADTVRAVRDEPAVCRFVLCYLAAFLVAEAARGSARAVAYAVFVLVGAAVTGAVHARRPLPRTVLWAVAWLGLLHCCGGLLPSPDPTQLLLYETWLLPGVVKVDQLVHAYGTGVATWAGWHAATGAWVRRGGGTLRRGVAALLVGTAAGLANELVELGLDLALPTLVGDLGNAAWDLVFNTTGAVLALLLVHAPRRVDDPPGVRLPAAHVAAPRVAAGAGTTTRTPT